MMTKRLCLLPLLFLTVAMAVWPQKAVRKIRSSVKSGQLDEAMTQVEASAADSLLKDKHKMHAWGVRVQRKINAEQNEKMYLGQAYDTLRFFNSVKGIFDYSLKAYDDGLAEGKNAKRLTRRTVARLLDHYHNLGVACRYYYQKGDYETALPFMETYLKTAAAPPMKDAGAKVLDRLRLPVMGYLCLKTCYELGKYDLALSYVPLALQDTLHLGGTLYLLSQIYLHEGQMGNYVDALFRGMAEAPGAPYFYTSLMDYYQRSDQFGRALAISDSLLAARPGFLPYLFGKSYLLMKMKRYEESIAAATALLETDSEWAEAYYNIGVCYCNMAAELNRKERDRPEEYKESHDQVKQYYAAARPYLETYRRLAPDRVRQWGPLLYRIYLNLNLGESFEEIGTLLQESARQEQQRQP